MVSHVEHGGVWHGSMAESHGSGSGVRRLDVDLFPKIRPESDNDPVVGQ